MTRKDYVLIAAALKAAATDQEGAKVFPVTAEEMRADIAGRLADAFAKDNPRFDRSRFLKAAGVQS